MTKPTDWNVVSETTRTGRYTNFGELCEALGVPCAGAVEEQLRIDGTLVTLSLKVDSGIVVGLHLETHRSPSLASGPAIHLTRETEFDRRAKEKGMSREVELSDDSFDVLVYVDSAASDVEVKAILQRDPVRLAAKKLIQQMATEVRIDHSGVSASFKDRSNLFHAPTLITIIGALLEVTRAGAPQGPTLSRPGEGLRTRLLLLLMPSLGAAAFSLWRYVTSHTLTVAGASLGLTLFLVALPWVRRSIRGASNSHRVATAVGSLLLLNLVGGGIAAARLTNCALDAAAGTLVAGKVVQMRTDEDDRTEALIEWENGEAQWVRSPPDWRVGQLDEQWFFPGRLGVVWTTRR